MDLIEKARLSRIAGELNVELLPASILTGEGLEDIRDRITETFMIGNQIAVLGVFNSDKTSLISWLTGQELAIGNLPGTTLEFTPRSL